MSDTLEFAVDAIVATVERWVEENDNVVCKLRYKPVDMCRLLKLRTWSLRYFVSVGEILEMLVPVLRKRVKLSRGAYGGLGVPANVLTGKAAERLLASMIGEQYPEGEELIVWRDAERSRQLANERREEMAGLRPRQVDILTSESLAEFVSDYQAQVQRARAVDRDAEHDKRRKRKPYRWNPW